MGRWAGAGLGLGGRDSYLLELCRYVVLNPVRTHMVEDPGQYRWSGYRATRGLSQKPAFLRVDWILGQFDKRSGGDVGGL